MCRAGGRRCPSHNDPAKIAARNQRRREAYASNKQAGAQTPLEAAVAQVTGLTVEQSKYFENSKAMKDGQLVKLYHGSQHEFTSFDPTTLGRGNDAWGNGFYFTDQQSVAQGYANESGSPTANVKEFYLNLTNPIYVDGKEHMSLNEITFSRQVAANILKQHPNAYLQPSESDEEMSFLADYAPEYWDKETHTKEELNRMIDNVAKEYFSDADWVSLESLYGREYGAAFLEAMRKETGHDGVIVDFGEDGKHYVAWFPEQMKLTSNTNPTNSHEF